MNTLPPMASDTTRVQIAGEAIDRVPSNSNSGGAYGQQRRRQSLSVGDFKKHTVSEKEVPEAGDERDVKHKQV